MSENTEATDPMAFSDGQSPAAPAEAPQSPREETLGDGIMSDKFVGDPDESTGQPEDSASSPETEETTTSEAESEEEKADRLRYADYTRKRQQDAEEARRREEEFNQRVASFEQRQREWEQRTTEQPQDITDAPASQRFQVLAQNIQQAIADPNTAPEQRLSLQNESAGVSALAQLATELQEVRQWREQVDPEFGRIRQTMEGLSQRQAQEVLGEVQEQRTAAVQALGEDVVAAAGPLIAQSFFVNGQVAAQNWNPPTDPKTGEPFTIAEYVSRMTGMEAQARQQAVKQNGEVKTAAKRNAANRGADTASEDNAVLTREEAIANW